jgi:hypothetical protein
MYYFKEVLICLAFLAIPTDLVRQILRRFELPLNRLELGFMSLFLGQVFFASFVFILSLAAGLSGQTVALGILLFLILDLPFYLIRKRKIRLSFRLERYEDTFLFILFLSAFGFLILLQRHMLPVSGETLLTPHNTFGDIQYHLAIINSFFLGNNFPPQNPIYAGVRLSYPFMIDFYSAVFRTVGFNLQYSLIIPGLIFGECVFAFFLLFAYRFLKSIKGSAIAFLIFVFNGGLGGYLMLKESLGSSAFLDSFAKSFSYVIDTYNFRFPNAVSSVFMAERPILVGVAAFLAVLILLFLGFDKEKADSELLLAGLIIGLLPLWHTHTLIDLALLLPFYAVSYWVYNKVSFKKVVRFIAPLFCFSLPLGLTGMLWHADQVFGGGVHFFSIDLGWIVGNEGILNFWFRNLGIFIPLLLVAFILLNKKQKLFYLPIFLIFVFANVFRFQPFDWDNYKILLEWFAASSVVAALLINALFNKGHLAKFLAVGILIFSTISGVLLILGDYQTLYGLFGREDVELAAWEVNHTNPNDLILTGPQHNQFSILAGRKILMGYPGYLWTQGIDSGARGRDIQKMYKGNTSLIKGYGVKYVVLGYEEKASDQPDEAFLDSNFRLVKQTQNFKIYQTIW